MIACPGADASGAHQDAPEAYQCERLRLVTAAGRGAVTPAGRAPAARTMRVVGRVRAMVAGEAGGAAALVAAMPPASAWTCAASTRSCVATSTRTGSSGTSSRPTAAEWPEHPPSSSTAGATTAPTTSTRSRASSTPRARDPGTPAAGRCPMTGSASFAWPRGGTGLAGPVTSRARTTQAAGPRLPSAPGRRPTTSGLPATRAREGRRA